MDVTTLLTTLQTLLPGTTLEAVPAVDQPTLLVPRERIADACRALRDTPELCYALLADLTACDYLPQHDHFEVIYLLASLGTPVTPGGVTAAPSRLRLKVRVPRGDARLPTVSGVYPSAGWAEREVYDLFGIVFEGHPDLRRILMPDDWSGHPLRKDYPVQVNVPVATRDALQLTEQEFVANIARQRQATGPRGKAD
jgi:NADH-quinone oxidoreductase subunit C